MAAHRFLRLGTLFLNVVLGVVVAGIGLLGYLLVAYLIDLRGGRFNSSVLAILGIIAALATAFSWAGVKLIRNAVRAFRLQSAEPEETLPPTDVAREPWLRNKEWRKREVVHGRTVGGPVLVLAFIFFAGPILLIVWAAFFNSPGKAGDGAIAPIIVMGAVISMVLGPLIYLWLRHRRYGNSVCRLLTLPGVIGDWFKADVECALPPDSGEPVIVRLKNLVPAGKRLAEKWRMEERLTVPVVAGARSVVPVRLRVPRHPAQVPLSFDRGHWARFWLGEGAVWHLELEKKAAGVDFFASFSVPIYDSLSAPTSEQRQQSADHDRQEASMDKSLKPALVGLRAAAVVEFLAAAVIQFRLLPFLQEGTVKFGRAGTPIPTDQFVAWAVPLLVGLGSFSVFCASYLVVSRRKKAH